MMLHVFTEEPSIKNVFDVILPKILPEGTFFKVYPHQGKQDLEKAIINAIPQISRIPGSKILITRDQDSGDCVAIKNRIIELVGDKCYCDFYVRIVCRELESWFLGDLEAVRSAYHRFKPENYRGKSDFRNVDMISSPNKYLLKIIPELAGRDHLPKLEVSETIAPFMNLEKNTSSSFTNTISAVRRLAGKKDV